MGVENKKAVKTDPGGTHTAFVVLYATPYGVGV
jgi:hypothetical protein